MSKDDGQENEDTLLNSKTYMVYVHFVQSVRAIRSPVRGS